MNSLYQILLYSQFILAAVVLIVLFFVTAPYGRFIRKGWGPEIPAKWAWVIQELPAFGTILIMFIINKGWTEPINWVFLLIWEAHYFQRTFIYPFKIQSGNKAYPFILVIFAIVFNIMNGFINGYYLFAMQAHSESWFFDPRLYIGAGIFIFGFYINRSSDRILIQTKKSSGGEYGIPRGGFFKFVSSAHYFGEWVEWTGWAILTWSLPGAAFSAFTFANLAPRAIAHHKWYKSKFPDYPGKRKAFIPGIW